MIIALLAAALLATPPQDAPASHPPMTAGQMYDGCVRYLAHPDRSPDDRDEGEMICALNAAIMLLSGAVDAAVQDMDPNQPDRRTFCLPESILEANGDANSPLARAFIDYVERNPASRDTDADAILERALAEKWPCPR